MSHGRKTFGPLMQRCLEIVDDDQDRLRAVKDLDRGWLMIENLSPFGDGYACSVRIGKNDARALRRYLDEFISALPDEEGEDDDE